MTRACPVFKKLWKEWLSTVDSGEGTLLWTETLIKLVVLYRFHCNTVKGLYLRFPDRRGWRTEDLTSTILFCRQYMPQVGRALTIQHTFVLVQCTSSRSHSLYGLSGVVQVNRVGFLVLHSLFPKSTEVGVDGRLTLSYYLWFVPSGIWYSVLSLGFWPNDIVNLILDLIKGTSEFRTH